MRGKLNLLRLVCVAVALFIAATTAACAHHYRAYDPYYNDYHVWNDREVGYYQQWAHETHRDPNVDFRKLPSDQQEEYWKWRHTHH